MGLREVRRLLDDLKTIETAEKDLLAIHDRVSGKATYVAEGGSPFDVDFISVMDDIHMQLGKELVGLGLQFMDDAPGMLTFDGREALDQIEDEVNRVGILDSDDPVGTLVERFNTQRRSIHKFQDAMQLVQEALDEIVNPTIRETAHGVTNPVMYLVELLNARE